MPVALPFVAAGASVLAAGASVYGGIQGANAQAEVGRQHMLAANRQADVVDMSAVDALSRGGFQASQVEGQGSKVISAQRAAYGSSGVTVGTGSAGQAEESTRAISDLDAAMVRNNAIREAWGLKQSAINLRTTGEYAQQAGANMGTGTLLSGIGGGLAGLGSAAGALDRTGMFSGVPKAAPTAEASPLATGRMVGPPV